MIDGTDTDVESKVHHCTAFQLDYLFVSCMIHTEQNM